jgi:homoserine dehydrogenase
VLADITGVLGREGISIASFIQHESTGHREDNVPLVIMTHQTTEGASQKAVEEISSLNMVQGPAIRIRVLD